MTITTPIQMRFFDMDSFGHVSNVAQQMYFDQGKTDLFRELWSRTEILARVPAVTVSVKTDFFSQIRFGDEICVVTEAEKIGHKSFTLLQRIMRGGARRVAADTRSDREIASWAAACGDRVNERMRIAGLREGRLRPARL